MTRSRSALADALNRLIEGGDVSVTETADAIIVYRLGGEQAKQIHGLLQAAGWTGIQAEDEGGALYPEFIDDEDSAITIRARKDGVPQGVEAVLTRSALENALTRRDLGPRLWVHGLREAFETQSVRFAPWGDTTSFDALTDIPSPRSVVRVLNTVVRFPDDLGRWLLRDPEVSIEGSGISIWRSMAVDMLARSLANEIEPDGNLLFRGPPATRFTVTSAEPVQNRDLSAISRAAKWVYESPREVENRHVLLSMEVARAALKGGSTNQLAAIAGGALEGAKIAYNFGVSQQSRDTLKALSDLRKSVSDETSKLSETTRGLATAIAGAVFANIGIMVARLSISPNNIWVPWAAVSLGVVLAIYVATMIASGAHFLRLQQTLRTEWRARLYRFLDDAEYQRMVTDPVRRAERAFWHASIAGGIMAVMLLVAVVIIAVWQP